MSEPASGGTSTISDRERIEAVLDSIRPAIRQDGGDIELVDFEEDEGRVRVRMVGACYACPMSMMTLKAGVEQRLRMEVPAVRTVEAI
ncbi:MAG: NifU family protein [Candidatus Palauibacterales bacterium]|nr:NifU family protein [Candidatus Palauibacterales bacterium]